MSRGLGFFLKLLVAFFALAAAIVITVMGSRPVTRVETSVEVGAEAETGIPLAWEALAILKTGENPLWFELGETGPVLISSPAEASLGQYKPWPLSQHIAGMLSWEDSLVLASNREGFIILSPRPDGAATLYRVSDPANWDAYTIASFYIYKERPTVLLYRDDFFSDPAPPLFAPALSLYREFEAPVPVNVPFLQSPIGGNDSGADTWEPVALMRGPGGFWYGRWTQPGSEMPQSRYLRAPGLDEYGDSVSVDSYRNAALPEPASGAPPFIADVLANMPLDFTDGTGSPALALISPSYVGERLFSAAGAGGFQDTEELSLLCGYYRESPAPFLLALLPDGRGVFAGKAGISQFRLPLLPENYVYTSAGLAGDALVACWEEQQDFAVGSAGFMVVEAAAFLPAYRKGE
jgi:hypothetical protein